jgi:hypothetical protein
MTNILTQKQLKKHHQEGRYSDVYVKDVVLARLDKQEKPHTSTPQQSNDGVLVEKKWLEFLIKFAKNTNAYDDAISLLKNHALSAEQLLNRKV